MSKKGYLKVKGAEGIYKQQNSAKYLAMKKINGKQFQSSFDSIFEAKQWRKTFDGISYTSTSEDSESNSNHSKLQEVWEVMQLHHFPTLATSTKDIWKRRYELLKDLEHIPMDKITPSKVTSWVTKHVEFFKCEDYASSGRGRAGRCNLNNELNMLVTIFNWYKSSEKFEKEAVLLTCPVKTKHRKLGFIKPLPDKRKQIDVQSAFLFFDYLTPLYRDLAMMQFFCAGRIGEICGLQWSNIDLENRRMLIKHSSVFHSANKTFLELKPFPKNREARPVFITDEIMGILKRRKAFRVSGNDFVFHVEGAPINYGTVQLNYREAQRKSKVPYSGTHILRHGMAKLARQVGGGLDAVLAMTGHKDLKLADHYSKSNEDDQKHFSEKIMEHVRKVIQKDEDVQASFENVVSLKGFKKAANS
ncbi:MAG TPA: tyrosine-type recombinase/integrase [Bacteriovoracaceae bacterium]|nr:tyrosine-type recombinase/integrase [Bacteriovoracaceae bacterium]